ncbi:MAG: DMT family transporter [Caulobacterales bacterium]|nr:DMT family transporter [Caulobacterales bacterium]
MSTILKARIIDWLTLLLLVVLWASAYSLTLIALGNIKPIIVVSIRLWIGAGFLFIICLFLKKHIPSIYDWRAWGSMAATGIVGSLIPFFLISTAQTAVPSALASIYLSATPLAAALLSRIFIKEDKINIQSAIGILFGIIGIIILFLPNLRQGNLAQSPIWAQLILVIAAFCYAGALIIVRLTSPKIDAIAISFGFVFCSAIASSPFALYSNGFDIPHFALEDILSAILLGLGPTAIASILYVRLVHKIGPIMVANFSNLVPIVSIFIGFIAFKEHIPPTAGAALIVILFGVWLVQKR